MIIALDFDGVVVDAIDECLLVSWNTFNGKGYQQFNKNTLESIPKSFREKFRNYRSYVRHDGHFIVPYYLNDEIFLNKDSFENVYSRISISDKDRFRNSFIEYRNKVRNTYPRVWTSLHKFLMDIESLLNSGDEFIIVSGKDSSSIHFLLCMIGVEFPISKIYGRMTNKSETLKSINNKAYMQGEKFIFIDDNLDNVKEAINYDIPSVWAEWGYNTKEQFCEAKQLKIPSLKQKDLSDFIKSLH
ncbi:hypothetical protein [Xenorhabdus bovienii]|uniref:hypothetical protein n=1 Tax=Xenorhabdus bovienii TaxID=40576 RepID=UPI00237D08A0|nr:hypothetical protein [Xenorhabdus bovienii]MDE1482962.1 hypothetical protein [Xenorhabdus bovienii]MDE9433729.1 hypothetical protein [Xenorhabdus bovienii]MDE9443076.1 hypothetical protein [Xenorhabdus bovienii]MDE9491355.1 hypothetical protein [Xenorhabdus bovienii]MDE9507706.1 hypothetical protein [Xenorhabdus bovienii]